MRDIGSGIAGQKFPPRCNLLRSLPFASLNTQLAVIRESDGIHSLTAEVGHIVYWGEHLCPQQSLYHICKAIDYSGALETLNKLVTLRINSLKHIP